MTSRPRRARLARMVVLCLLGASWAGQLWGDYRDNYRAAIEAIEAGRYEEAVQELRNAIAQRAESKVGAFGRRYLPHYYLGLALQGLGDCRSAVDAWATAESQGEIKEARDEYADLKKRRKQCTDLLAELDGLREQAAQAIETAQQSSAKVTSLSHQPALESDWSGYAARQREAGNQLSLAETLLRQGQDEANRAKLEQARNLAVDVAKTLDQVASEARARLRDVNDATAGALEQLGVVADSANNVLKSIADLKPFPPVLRRHAEELQQIIAEAKAKQASGTTNELVALQDRLTVTMSQLRRAAERPPRPLVEAVEAFLAGDFPKVLEALGTMESRDPRALAQRCLLRAASRHALYVLEGEREPHWLDEARADITACARLDPPPEPLAKYFSPRFIDFYRVTRQAVAPAGEPSTSAGDGAATDRQPSSSP